MNEYKKQLLNYILSSDESDIGSHRLLSGILSFSGAVKDPDALADSLLKRYLTIGNILDHAESGRLLKEGLDKNTFFLMRLVFEISARREVQSHIGTVLRSPVAACRFLEDTYSRIRTEEVRLICLDPHLRIADYVIIARGNQYVVTFEKDKLLKRAVDSGCKLCILAHNHPGAPSKPSAADYAVTNQLRVYLGRLGIRLAEHIIIGEDGAKSMFADNMLQYYLSCKNTDLPIDFYPKI